MRSIITDENALLDWISQQGFVVVEADLPLGLWGATFLVRREVHLHQALSTSERLYTLAHESLHIANTHDGHQPRRVEERIDEMVASQLIDPIDYAYAETQYGWNAGAIAAELSVPKIAVQAYRRLIEREIIVARAH